MVDLKRALHCFTIFALLCVEPSDQFRRIHRKGDSRKKVKSWLRDAWHFPCRCSEEFSGACLAFDMIMDAVTSIIQFHASGSLAHCLLSFGS